MASDQESDALKRLYGLLKDNFPGPDPLQSDGGGENIELWVEQRPGWFRGWIDPDATVHILIKMPRFKGNFKRQTVYNVGAAEVFKRICVHLGLVGSHVLAEDVPRLLSYERINHAIKGSTNRLVSTQSAINDSFSQWAKRVLDLSVRPDILNYHKKDVDGAEDQ